MLSIGCTLRNPGPWGWFSENLEARVGILSRLEGMDIRYVTFVKVREKECRNQGKGGHSYPEAATKVLERRKGSVVV
jgi:hypothetical protein